MRTFRIVRRDRYGLAHDIRTPMSDVMTLHRETKEQAVKAAADIFGLYGVEALDCDEPMTSGAIQC